MPSKIQSLITQFLATKTRREKILLFTALMLLFTFIVVEYIYTPLLRTQSTLLHIKQHAITELALASDSLDSVRNQHEIQHSKTQALQARIATLQNRLAHINTQEPFLNPFDLSAELIAFANSENLTLHAFEPHPLLQAISIEGEGEFWQILSLLSFLESHIFLSIQHIELSPQEHEQIHFSILAMDIRKNTPQGAQ